MHNLPIIVWQHLDDGGQLAEVKGGWLYKIAHLEILDTVLPGSTFNNSQTVTLYDTAVTFIPDPDHTWFKELEMQRVLLREKK